MTRLIVPAEDNATVSRMVERFELRRASSVDTNVERLRQHDNIRRIPILSPRREDFLPALPQPESQVEIGTADVIETTLGLRQVPGSETTRVDWWAEAHKAVQGIGDENLKQWRIAHGYDRYVTVMQGPLPIPRGARKSTATGDSERSGYVNVFGDAEIAVSKNCVMQSESVHHDHSDFMRHVPDLIVCNAPPRPKLHLPHPTGAQEYSPD
jgi:hypothetical protein